MFSKCCTADFPPKQEGARRQSPSWREEAAAILPISRVICIRACKNYFPRNYSKDHGKSCTVGGASQKLKAEKVFYRLIYWFDGALKGKLEGGGSCKLFQKSTAPPPPPLPIKNERPLNSGYFNMARYWPVVL